MENNVIGVGIIGCGKIADVRHAPEYFQNKNVKILGFYDQNYERARAISERYDAKVYENHHALLNNNEISAVSICTINSSHAQFAIDALNSKKHVLCEKPMASSISECEQMIEAAKKNECLLMIGHNQRFSAAHKKAKEILKSGELGNILGFKTSFGHGGPESWGADKGTNTWFFNKKENISGPLMDLGVHKIDLIKWLISDEIVEVKASVTTVDKRYDNGNLVDVADNAIVILKFASNIIGSLHASWVYYGYEDNSTILYCQKGIMKIYDDSENSIVVIKKDKERLTYQLNDIQTNDNQTASGVIDSFVNSVINNLPAEVDAVDGMNTVKVTQACIESALTGKTVCL